MFEKKNMSDITNSNNFNCDYEKDSNDITKKYKSKLTLNSHGMMFPLINPYFTQVMELMDKSKPVADLGVAYGLTTKKLLENGFEKVIANDLEEKHLKDLWETTPESFHSRLELMPGNVLNLEFDNDSFGGIIAIRWLQFIHGDDVRKVFKKFYDWLQPGMCQHQLVVFFKGLSNFFMNRWIFDVCCSNSILLYVSFTLDL